jgi:hypothetical protein
VEQPHNFILQSPGALEARSLLWLIVSSDRAKGRRVKVFTERLLPRDLAPCYMRR